MGQSVTEIIVEHLSDARYSAISPVQIDRAKTRLIDSLGLIAAGVRASGNTAAKDLVKKWGGHPEATILNTQLKVPAMNAAFINALLLRSYDFEPVGADREGGQQIPSHITGTTVAVALAVGEARKSSGTDLLTALIYGDDIAARLGHATGFDVYGGGDNTGTINVMGGVVTASLLMGHTPEQITNGLGLAMNQASGTIDNIFDKSLAFKLPIALSARNAIFSAEMSALGFDGPKDPLGGRFGFLNQWSDSINHAAITNGLGKDFYADAVIKPWPTCRASQAAIDATLQLVREHNITHHDVAEVRIHVNSKTKNGFVGQDFKLDGNPEVTGAFSMQFSVATAIVSGDVGLEHLTSSHMLHPDMTTMYEKIEIVGSLPDTEPRAAEAEIMLQTGERYHKRVETVFGDIHFAPQTSEQIETKFRKNVAWNGGLSEARADSLFELVDKLEEASDVSAFSQLLSSSFDS